MTREEAIKILRREIECLSHTKCEDCILQVACDPIKTTPYDSEYIEVYEMAIKALEQEPKTGHWEWVQYDYNPKIGNWHCSECRCIVVECVGKNEKDGIPFYKYCPQCGCRMVEPQESDHKCHTCKHYTSGEHDGSCGSYICKGYSNWESEVQDADSN